jgi:EVE domain
MRVEDSGRLALGRTVERGTLGSWLLKCNPAAWDLRAFLDSGERRLTSWAVRPGYRSALMAEGDPVLFWVSGDGRQGFARGIWGAGVLAAEAEAWSESTAGRWRHPAAHHGVRARVRVDIPILAEPVTDAALRSAGVDDLEVQRMPFAANPSWVPATRLSDLARLLLPSWGWPPRDPGSGRSVEGQDE